MMTPEDPTPPDKTEGSDRFPDYFYEYRPDRVTDWHSENNCLFVRCANGLELRVAVYSDAALRFRYAPLGRFERSFSYALDPGLSAAPESGFDIAETDPYLQLRTGSLVCRNDLRVALYDRHTEELILEEAAPFYARYSILQGWDQLRLQKRSSAEEAFFGLGDKTCRLNLRGKRLENWNTDAYAFTKQTDPLYRAIPFYYGLNRGRAYGIFVHNTHRTHFDFAAADPEVVAFQAGGGEMDYFFLYGPSLLDVARRYHRLTGAAELPPRWALGFHQCRWSYYPESRVRELAAEFRERRIPCDAIYLDIDYMDGYRCFTWNNVLFPQPARLIRDLAEAGFQTVVMIDPGIRVDPDYAVYRYGLEKGYFCRRSGGELMRGPVWPPECVFPEFSRADVRAWWGECYRGLYLEDGVSGFWNDMNEPAIFLINRKTFPDNVLHDVDGAPADHSRVHNVYGQLMSRATYEGLKKLRPEKRPFVLTRATFSGGQRYAAVWTGDNIASWEHLRLANIQSQRLSISGFSFVGSDVGGFVNQPDGELFVRWLQLSVFHPLFRVHSMGNNVDGSAEIDETQIKAAEAEERLDQEPWSFGAEHTDRAREAINLRYELLPYFYTAFRQQSTEGRPFLRSLVFEDQEDPRTYEREREFLCGDHLLISPVERPGAVYQNPYLPRGRWFDYWTGRAFDGGKTQRLALRPDRIPVLVRAGAVIPNFPVMQYTGQLAVDTLTLRVYPGAAKSSLYEDAGEGYDYQKGD